MVISIAIVDVYTLFVVGMPLFIVADFFVGSVVCMALYTFVFVVDVIVVAIVRIAVLSSIFVVKVIVVSNFSFYVLVMLVIDFIVTVPLIGLVAGIEVVVIDLVAVLVVIVGFFLVFGVMLVISLWLRLLLPRYTHLLGRCCHLCYYCNSGSR